MKRLFILATLFLIIISKTIYSQNVDIKTNYPPNVQQNQEFEIKINISKGNVSGFARLQLDFPEGFTVRSTQMQGATFSFKENKARFLWMALPAESEISVNCMVTIGSANTGNQEFEGGFSYVLDNETQRIPIPKNTIVIEGTGLVVQKEVKTDIVVKEEKSTEDAEKLEAERRARELAIAKAEKEKNERDEQEKRLKEEAAQKAREEALANEEAEKKSKEETTLTEEEKLANLEKRIEEIEKDTLNTKNEEIVIENVEDSLKIEQERKAKEEAELIAEEERLAKIKEEEAALNAKNEEVLVNEDSLKIEQEKIAQEEALALAEKEKLVREAEEARLAQIQKEEEKTTQEVTKITENNEEAEKIEQERIAREAEEARLAQIQKEEEKTTQEVTKTTENNEENERIELERKANEEARIKFEAERIAKEETDRLERERIAKEVALKTTKTEIKTSNSNINKATINSNIDFRIQVGASRQTADKGYYSKLDKGISEFKVMENTGNDGWFRYTIGSFSNIQGAQNLLPRVKQLGFDCFVVAFKDGQRIPVQDAKKLIGQ